jgi:hypothetical protein
MLTYIIIRLMSDTLSVPQPMELVKNKLESIQSLVELMSPNPQTSVIDIKVNNGLDDFEQE